MYGQPPQKVSPKPKATPMPDDDREVGLDEWDDIVADRYKVPRSLMKSVRMQESGGNVNAKSPTGVRGRYQVTEATAKQYGLDRNNPWQQSVAAAKHLRKMFEETDGADDDEKWLGAVGKYYGGSGAVKNGVLSGGSVDGVSNPAEHVRRVAEKWGQYRREEGGQPATKKEQLRQSITGLQDELVARTPQPQTPRFQPPIDMRLNAPNEAQKAFDRAAAAVQPAPAQPKPELRTRQTLGQMKQQARSFQPVTQEDILRYPVTPQERRASVEASLAEGEREKQRQRLAAKLKLEEEASRASQSTLGKMGTRFARGAVRGVMQTPFEFVQMANPDPVVQQTMGRIADESKEWQSQNLPVDNRNPATLNVFKPEFYSLENIGKAATETVPEVLGEMLPQMALARGAGGVARLAAPELAAATIPRMASTTGAQLAARTAAGGYGAAQQSTQAYQKALAAGMTPEQAARAAAIEAPIGFSEFLGSPGTTGFTRPGTTIRREMREEGLQELGQTAASGLAGKYVSGYDADKPLTDIAGESIGGGLLGAATGGIVATPGARLQAYRQGQQQRATRSAIDQRSAANAAAIASQPATAQPVTESPVEPIIRKRGAVSPQPATEPLTEPLAAQPQPSAPGTAPIQPQPTQPEGLPRLPARELSAQDRFAQVYGAKEPVENRINAMIDKAETLLGSQNENDRKMGERMMNRALTAIRQTEGYLAEAKLPPDAERPFTAVRDAIEARLSNTGKAKNTPSQVTTPESAQVQPLQQPTASDALRAEADAAKIKAAEFEQVGDFTQAAATYQAAHQNLKRLRQSLGRPKTPEAVAQINQIDREISIADANRRKAMQAAQTAQRQANAPTAGLPAQKPARAESAPLFRPEAQVNPEGGNPQMPEPTFTDRLNEAARRDEAARGKAKPAKRLLSRIAELGGISDRYAGELQGVKDARRIGVIRQKADMSPDVLARQLQSEGYDVDPEDLNTLWEAARRDIAGRDERTSGTAEIERRLAEEEAAYNEQQATAPTERELQAQAEPTNRLREVEYEGGEMQRYSKPLEGQATEKEDWELTREQWGRKETDILNASIDANERFNLSGMAQRRALTRIDELINGTAHRREVMAALREGKPVPAEVLADYPDLQPKQAFQPDTADLREVREFMKRKPQTEQFTEEPPTAPLARMENPPSVRDILRGKKGEFGKLSAFARQGEGLAAQPALRKMLGLGEMPVYRLPGADINPQTGKPFTNPEWKKAAQETMDALSDLAKIPRSSRMGIDGLQKAYAALQEKGSIPPEVHSAFVDMADRYTNFVERVQKMLDEDPSIADVINEVQSTYERGQDLTTDQESRLKNAVRVAAEAYGINQHYSAKSLWAAIRDTKAEYSKASGRTTQAGTRETVSAGRVAEESQRAKSEVRESAAKAEVKIGEYYTFTEPAIVYKNGQPVTIQSKKRGRVTEIAPDGSITLKRQDGGYATKQASDLTDASGNTPVAETSTDTRKPPRESEPKPSQKEEVRNVGGRLTTEEGRRKVEEARQAMENAVRRSDYTKPGERADAIAAARERVQEAQAEAHLEAARLRREMQAAKQQPARPAKSIDQQIKDIRDLVGWVIDQKEADRQIAELKARRKPKIAERREGQPKTRADVESSPEFKRWFGDSVVTENGKPGGKPLVVYHGSPAKTPIAEFSKEKANPQDTVSGFYFTEASDVASGIYAVHGSQINKSNPADPENAGATYPVYISLKNPIDLNDYNATIREKLGAATDRVLGKGAGSGLQLYLDRYGNNDNTPHTLVHYLRLSAKPGGFLENQKANLGILATRILKAAGYDGATYIGANDAGVGNKKPHRAWIAFEPSQIKSAIGNRGTFDPDSTKITERREAPGFFSQLERVIDAKMPAKASVAQVRAIIGNPQSGVKPEEVKWTGLDDYLRTVQNVTKEDVLNWLKANRVEVREVESEKKAYSKYKLPGGENYRELLLTLPPSPKGQSVPNYRTYAKDHGYSDAQVDSTWQTDDPLFREWEAKNEQAGKPLKPEYESSHFDEPNILAHIRFNDRTDADGKRVLHIEEIQSDQGQDIRKQKNAWKKHVETHFDDIISKMKSKGVLEVNCD